MQHVSIPRLGQRCTRLSSLLFAKTILSTLGMSAWDQLALNREYASNAEIVEASDQRHMNGEILGKYKSNAYMEVINSYKHRYGVSMCIACYVAFYKLGESAGLI